VSVKEVDNIKMDSTEGFMEDPRYKQCNKEALYGVILGLLNLVWWYVFGYGLGDKPVEGYTYILGFPSWFFFSCVLGAIVFIGLTFFMVDKLFKHMPLDKFTEEEAKEYLKSIEGKEA